MRRSVVTGRTIYEDARLTLSTSALTMRGYWLPFALSRTVRFTEITAVNEHERGDESLPAWPRWGRGAKRTWFPLDLTRSRRTVAVALWLDDESRVVITPANPARFIALLAELGLSDAHSQPSEPVRPSE